MFFCQFFRVIKVNRTFNNLKLSTAAFNTTSIHALPPCFFYGQINMLKPPGVLLIRNTAAYLIDFYCFIISAVFITYL